MKEKEEGYSREKEEASLQLQLVVETLVQSQKDFQNMVCNMIQNNQQENREAQKRLHERLDQIIQKESVPSGDCEQRRTHCRACMNTQIDAVEKKVDICTEQMVKKIIDQAKETEVKIKESKGYPPWVTWIITGSISLVIVLIGTVIGLLQMLQTGQPPSW